MGARSYHTPPSSTSEKPLPLRTNPVVSYADALAHGNPLLYLPRSIRNKIYVLSLSQHHLTNIEIIETGSILLPQLCSVDHIFHTEVTALLLRTTTFTIPSDAAIFNFFTLLNAYENGAGYSMITKLELVGLAMFERGEFMANGTRLLTRMPNLKEVTVMIDLRDLVFVDGKEEGKGKVVDLDDLVGRWDLDGLMGLRGLERIEMVLVPFMALGKMVRELEGDVRRKTGEGLEGFRGLKNWIEMRVAERGGVVEVVCPRCN
jgi:hypothetical protein